MYRYYQTYEQSLRVASIRKAVTGQMVFVLFDKVVGRYTTMTFSEAVEDRIYFNDCEMVNSN